MKSVVIITIADNINIGTYLQAISLYKNIKLLGYNPIIIDYYRPASVSLNKMKRIFRNREKTIFRKILSLGYVIYYSLIRKRLFNFYSKHVKLTSIHYTSLQQLEKMPPKGDIYMTGSDQVWNSIYNEGIDSSFYLGFIGDDYPKVAYAASIGMNSFNEGEEKQIKKLLGQYRKITMREQEACELLNSIGIKNVENVLDPTLLLRKEDWIDFSKTCSFRKKEPYLLIYSVENKVNGILNEKAKEIALARKLKIYAISTEKVMSTINADRYFPYALPDMFIKLFQYADFVMVSSFHGTAFSINLEKQFITFTPDKYSTRICSLLRILNMENCLWSEGYDISYINYNDIRVKLEEQRKKSIGLLKSMMN